MSAAVAKPAAGKTEKKSKGMIIMIALMLVLVAGALFVGKTFLGGKPAGKDKEKTKAEEGISLPMDEFLVNLNGGGDHYLRTTLALGLKKGVTEEQVKEKVPAIRDATLSVLRAKALKDLTKPDAQDKLKDELTEKINTAMGEDTVLKVYFTAFATQ